MDINISELNLMSSRRDSTESQLITERKLEFVGDGETENTNWSKLELLGAGSVSKVYRGTTKDEESDIELSVKQLGECFIKQKPSVEDDEILRQLSHENLLNYLGYCKYFDTVYFFYDMFKGESLHKFISENGKMSEEIIRNVTQQIVEGVSYLHKKKIVHRNLKSSNILIDKDSSVKITDTELTKYYQDLSEENSTTYRFRAPETFRGSFQYSSDIWSLGCLVIHMLTGEVPYAQLDEKTVFLQLNRNNAFPAENLPQNISVTLKNLILSLLEKTPELRPAANGISSDSFISERYISKEIPKVWKRGELLGRGQYGKVFQVIDENQPLEVKFAVKDIKITQQGKRPISVETKTSLRREAEILLILEEHERIVPFYGFVSSQNVISIFLGYMAKGSLYDYYKDNGPIPEEKCRLYTRQILEGLIFLHELNVVHRDVKSLNVLLETDDNIRLTDFGISKFLDTATSTCTAFRGTDRWIAPECINDDKHGLKADIWSLGCTVVEMLTGKVPYHNISFNGRVIFKGGKGEPPDYPENLSVELREFLNESFVANPINRKSSKEMLLLSFVKTAEAEIRNPVKSDLVENVTKEVDDEFLGGKRGQRCRKNCGHEDFIPIGKFQMKHLPKKVQDLLLYEFIMAIADLTVKVDVGFGRPYKHHKTGSGLIYEVEKYVAGVTSNKSITVCPCDKCRYSNKASDIWFRVRIITSAILLQHRIQTDESEISVRLFYDRPDSLNFQLHISKIFEENIEKDVVFLECVSCDIDMLDKVMTSAQHFEDLRYKVYNKYKRFKDIYKTVFIVSHPHGASKHVTIGEWVDKHSVDENRSWVEFGYTTSTCPGSTGAYVHILGYSGRVWHYPHLHSGCYENQNLNFSTRGFIIK